MTRGERRLRSFPYAGEKSPSAYLLDRKVETNARVLQVYPYVAARKYEDRAPSIARHILAMEGAPLVYRHFLSIFLQVFHSAPPKAISSRARACDCQMIFFAVMLPDGGILQSDPG